MITVQPIPFYSVWKYKPLIERITFQFPQLLLEKKAVDLLADAPQDLRLKAYNLQDFREFEDKVGRLYSEAVTDPRTLRIEWIPTGIREDAKDIAFKVKLQIPAGKDVILIDPETRQINTDTGMDEYEVAIVVEDGWKYVWKRFIQWYTTAVPRKLNNTKQPHQITYVNPETGGEETLAELDQDFSLTWLYDYPENWLSRVYTFIKDKTLDKKVSSIAQWAFTGGFAEAFDKCNVRASCTCDWFNFIATKPYASEWILPTNTSKRYTSHIDTKELAKKSNFRSPAERDAVLNAIDQGKEVTRSMPDQLVRSSDPSAVNTRVDSFRFPGDDNVVVNAGKVYIDGKPAIPIDGEIEIADEDSFNNLVRNPCIHILRILAGVDPSTGKDGDNPDGNYPLPQALATRVGSSIWQNKNNADGANPFVRMYKTFVESHKAMVDGALRYLEVKEGKELIVNIEKAIADLDLYAEDKEEVLSVPKYRRTGTQKWKTDVHGKEPSKYGGANWAGKQRGSYNTKAKREASAKATTEN